MAVRAIVVPAERARIQAEVRCSRTGRDACRRATRRSTLHRRSAMLISTVGAAQSMVIRSSLII